MSQPVDDLVIPVVQAVAKPMVDRVRTWVPAVVVSFDKAKWSVKARPLNRLIVIGADDEPTEITLPAANMPLGFWRCGGFIHAASPNVGDKGRIAYSSVPLDQWKGDGKEYAVRAGRYALTDAVFLMDTSDYAHPPQGVEAGTHVMGAENGPRSTIDRLLLNYEIRARHTASIAALRVIVDAPEGFFVNGVRVA